MNTYFAEFQATDRIATWHQEARERRPLKEGPPRHKPVEGRSRKYIGLLAAFFLILSLVIDSAPARAAGASVERLNNIDSVLAVAFPENFPVGSLMRADCAFLARVEHPDGSAKETLSCTLSLEPVMIPDFQGVAPSQALTYVGGPCQWLSEYWYITHGLDVYADSFRAVVTPAGRVHVTSFYSASGTTCG